MVAGGLAGAAGAVELLGLRFREGWVVPGQSAVDLVGADIQETKGSLLGLGQGTPVGPHQFEQAEGAQDVSLDEVFGTVDGAVHMAFGSKVQHGTGGVLFQPVQHKIAANEARSASEENHKRSFMLRDSWLTMCIQFKSTQASAWNI